ncbi:MAG: hypothetical protein WCV67_21545, partial [Victivallaceae bacterium]
MEKELIKNLDYLGLVHLRDEVCNLLEAAAKKGTSTLDFFSQAINAEAAHKRGRAIERRINQAH